MEAYWQEILDRSKNRVRYPQKKRRERKQKKQSGRQRSGTFVGTYHDYLLSPQWARKRRKAIRHYGGRCTICTSPDALRVHHRHYRTLFHESMADLDLLCNGCHQNHHEHEGKCLDPMSRKFAALVASF